MQKQFVLALREFDKSTREDILSARGIISQLYEFSQSTIEEIKTKGYANILDVGSGTGVKSALIARYINEKYKVDINLDSFEPNEEQHVFLLETYKKNPHFTGRIFNSVFDCKILDKKYDYILFLHSLYQFDRDINGPFKSLNGIDNYLKNSGTCIFMLKSIEGDFEEMKRYLFPILGKQNPISIYNIQYTLKKLRMPYRIGYNVPIIFPINHLKSPSEIARDISFVLIDTLNYQSPTDEQFELMGKWIIENAHKYEGKCSLNIPDSILFSYRS